MKSTNNFQKHAIIAGFLVSTIFPIIVFSDSYYFNYLQLICYYGEFWNSFFWGIIFPLFIVFLFWHSAKKLKFSLNQISYLKACFKFSLKISSKLIIVLIVLYLLGEFAKRVSYVFLEYYYYLIIAALIIILELTFVIMILAYISSLIIVKLSQNSQTLNSTK